MVPPPCWLRSSEFTEAAGAKAQQSERFVRRNSGFARGDFYLPARGRNPFYVREQQAAPQAQPIHDDDAEHGGAKVFEPGRLSRAEEINRVAQSRQLVGRA